MEVLEYLLMEIKMLEFPPIKSIKHVYDIFLGELKRPLYPTVCKTMDKKELTIFYVLEYLIGFVSLEMDTFYGQEGYLKDVRQMLFMEERAYMINYLFKTVTSVILRT